MVKWNWLFYNTEQFCVQYGMVESLPTLDEFKAKLHHNSFE